MDDGGSDARKQYGAQWAHTQEQHVGHIPHIRRIDLQSVVDEDVADEGYGEPDQLNYPQITIMQTRLRYFMEQAFPFSRHSSSTTSKLHRKLQMRMMMVSAKIALPLRILRRIG